MGRRLRSKRVRINRFKSTRFKRNRIKSNRIKRNSIKKRNTSKKSRKSFKKIKNTSNRLFLGGLAPGGSVERHKQEQAKAQTEISKTTEAEALKEEKKRYVDSFDPSNATAEETQAAIDAALNGM
uniref:Uncharacterized protein n=1 Tax=viral metagenome TaxID=1070528 RepID=A0A6C0CDE4_9ZZZZ